MKVTHPKAILLIVILLFITSVATIYVQARFVDDKQIGNPNPVIEWVLIQSSSKTPGNSGVSITIQGYNFTATNNEVRTHGKVLKTGLSSVEKLAISDSRIPGNALKNGIDPQKARIITFELPSGIPCSLNEQCPLNVVNKNGTSNTVSFKLSLPQ